MQERQVALYGQSLHGGRCMERPQISKWAIAQTGWRGRGDAVGADAETVVSLAPPVEFHDPVEPGPGAFGRRRRRSRVPQPTVT